MPILVDAIGGNSDSRIFSQPVRISFASTSVNPAYDLERRVFERINAVRAENALAPLVWDESVAELAREHSRSMAEHKFFSHRGLDGLTVDGRAETIGLGGWNGIAENIAALKGQNDPGETVIKNWLKSPGHRQNLLGGRWSQSAIGVAAAADGTYYFTQVFMLR